jgi:hypothetical protein
VREFKTAAKRHEVFEGAEPIAFTLDGEEYTAYPPSPGQLALMLASQADSRDESENVAGIIDFFDGLLDDEGRDAIRRRLLDRDDPFDFDMVRDIIEGLFEEWSARPTKSPSASRTSQRSGGARSTAKRRSTE